MGRTVIIAEAGVNHNGSLEIAKKLIDAASRAGANYVKFQTFDPKKIVTRSAEMAGYQKENLGRDESQEEMLEKIALKQEDFISLAEYCKEVGIGFLSTPFDIESIYFLNNLQSIWKVPSGEITNYPYLLEIAKTGKEVILSTGMSTLGEVEDAVGVLKSNGTCKITLLHCTTEYPAPFADVNLRAMNTLKDKFGLETGYSDHTKGIEIPVAAVAMGATVIEKHFTLDRNMEGPDHKASLEPQELCDLVRCIRNVEMAMGSGKKEPAPSEMKNIAVVRKSIVAAHSIKKGEILSEENLTTKRPGNGMNPMLWTQVIGKPANRDYQEDELIEI
ncbi:MAG: N-acetylneuraminate synthase [Lachnospiraceae bacterium]|nr:N-acetylneuraminate synthase [Lachnospiraceae bacterium]